MTETRLLKSPTQLRAEVEALMRDDLIGPKGGPAEELVDPPIDIYLLGLLAPRFLSVTGGDGSERQRTHGTEGHGSDGDDAEELLASDVLPEDDLASGVGGSDTVGE